MKEKKLAVHGGNAIFPTGAPAWPVADEDVRTALVTAYENGSWGKYHGPNCQRVVAMLAEIHGIEHVKLCASGTVGVELALRGLGVGPGDEVAVAGYDFSGNFRCIEAVGAKPVLVDIHSDTLSIDIQQLDAAGGDRLRCIIISHLHSGLAPMPAVMQWARAHDVLVVEDACQAHGAIVDRRIAGTWGDVGVLSFGGSKLLSAGRGGALLTRRDEVMQRIKIFADRGNDAYPLSELQAAVLVPQLEKLDSRNERRRQSARILFEDLGESEHLTPVIRSDEQNQPSYYKVAWYLEPAGRGQGLRDEFVAAIQAEGIALDNGFHGFTRRSARRCRRVGALAASQRASDCLVVLHHPVLLQEPDIVQQLADALRDVARAITKHSS